MRVLVAEDDPISRRLLAASLTRMGHEVIAVDNGGAAWTTLCEQDIRLVVADWEMPAINGLELVRKIRARGMRPYVFVILLTARMRKQDLVLGMEAGADDYMTKPWDEGELMVRLKAGARVLELYQELDSANEQLKLAALVDALTGVPNRRAFDEEFGRQREQARRFWRALSVLMIDIDHFKGYNDALGHGAGDEALRSVAALISRELRQVDTVYRYGGEEFICTLPETDEAGTLTVAERVREAVATAGIRHPGNPPWNVVTVSIGMALFDVRRDDEDLVRQADEALYAAKAAGRNRVRVWQPQDAPARS